MIQVVPGRSVMCSLRCSSSTLLFALLCLILYLFFPTSITCFFRRYLHPSYVFLFGEKPLTPVFFHWYSMVITAVGKTVTGARKGVPLSQCPKIIGCALFSFSLAFVLCRSRSLWWFQPFPGKPRPGMVFNIHGALNTRFTVVIFARLPGDLTSPGVLAGRCVAGNEGV